ncbi:MAG: DUF4112 domain-containing protein [Sphingomonas sp.]|nr:DUF4112 domain-containing protein [Sphingomonas sp.]
MADKPRSGPIPAIPLAADPVSVRQRLIMLEHLLEGLVTIPGINRKIGLDVMLDIIPAAGSTVGAVMGAYMLWEARNLGMTRWQMARMIGNVGIDFGLGLIPWVGAIPDYFFRSNTRNMKIIKRHLDRHHPASAIIDGGPHARS